MCTVNASLLANLQACLSYPSQDLTLHHPRAPCGEWLPDASQIRGSTHRQGREKGRTGVDKPYAHLGRAEKAHPVPFIRSSNQRSVGDLMSLETWAAAATKHTRRIAVS